MVGCLLASYSFLLSSWLLYSGGDLVGYQILVFPRVRCFVGIQIRYWSWFLRQVVSRLAIPFLLPGWFRFL